MKKRILFLGMLLSVGLICACSSSDDINNESDEFINFTSIDEGDIFVELSDFFKTAFTTEKKETFNFKNNLSNEENPCIVINNEDEFMEAYTGGLNLPAIDFSKYILIIGKVYLPAGTFIDDMSIRQTNSAKTTLYINCIQDTKGCYVGVMYYDYYWKLFPKFYVSKINVEISREKGEVDNNKKR